ncbi:MAG TPA: MFS transporter [Candidatus Limnocylindria bacterium]|nr:MFS transporter [Candidatus Limnocylindria bacterium]
MFERFPSLAHADVRRYLAARLLVSVAVQMQTVAVGWQVYQTTRNPLDLGFIGLSQFLPFVVLVLPAGHVADHFDRRRVIFACYLLAAVASSALLVFSLAGMTSVLPIFGVMAIFGIVRAFNMPTSQALLPNLVPRAAFGNAVALNTSTLQLATIGGPAIAGLLILVGTPIVYAVVTVLIVLSAFLILGLQGGRGSGGGEPMSVGTLLSGVRFVRDHRPILGCMSLDLFAVLFGGATALLPAIASDVLHVGPTGLGLLRAAPAIGAALAGAALAWQPPVGNVGRWLFGGVIVFGLSIFVFGLSRSFVVSMVALAILGGSDMVSMYIRHLLVQLQTPDAIRGRVSAVNAVFIGASNELGEFESGVTAAWWGVVPAVLVGGAATLLVALAWTRLFPMLWQLDRFPETPTTVERTSSAQEALRGTTGEPG